MPRRKLNPPAEVITRQLVPEPAQDTAAVLNLLYQPVQQLTGEPAFTMEFVVFTPELAQEWVSKAHTVSDFRQRPVRANDVRRWRNLYATQRFVNFLPNQPICTDPDGIMLNGMHRLTALSESPEGTEAGFVVIRNVPQWMFAFFDTNRVRTIKDVFHIGQRVTGPQTASAMKLALRYEEFLLGVRSAYGWRHWAQVRDEHQDIDSFYSRRDELQDWYGVGEKVYRVAKLLVPSVMVFRFYQTLAWPEGDIEIEDFCVSLLTAQNAGPNVPIRLLADWSHKTYENRVEAPTFAKREVHLHLLMRVFEQMQNNSRPLYLTWAYGNAMAMPYHPKGHDIAIKNVRLALEEMDANAAPDAMRQR